MLPALLYIFDDDYVEFMVRELVGILKPSVQYDNDAGEFYLILGYICTKISSVVLAAESQS